MDVLRKPEIGIRWSEDRLGEGLKGKKDILAIKAKDRKIIGGEKNFELREPAASYGINFTPENGPLSLKNSYFWAD